MFQFQLKLGDRQKIDDWLFNEVYPEIIAKQKQDPEIADHINVDEHGREYPYFGAVGGDLTYSFTPTSLGTIVRVTSCGKTLDLTDYDMW